MYFESLSDLLAMGGTGHAPYIWSCYAITFLVLAYNLWQPIAQRAKVMRELSRKIRREAQAEQQKSKSVEGDGQHEASA